MTHKLRHRSVQDGTDTGPVNMRARASSLLYRFFTHRFTWSAVVVCLAFVCLIVFGPEKEVIDRQFEYHGAQGEMRIVPEISIDEGHSAVHKIPTSLMTPPPPVTAERKPEETTNDGTREIPKATELEHNVNRIVTPIPSQQAQKAAIQQEEMLLPKSTRDDLYVIEMTRPVYPLDATEAERRTLGLFVIVSLFVNKEGIVTDVMVGESNASAKYIREAKAAVMTWKFGWKEVPKIGRWVPYRWDFRSPYRNREPADTDPISGS